MKLLSCSILLASLFATAISQAQSKLSVSDQILPLLTQQTLALKAHDTDRFLATYLHNPELIFIANGQVIRGRDSLREQQQKWLRSSPSDPLHSGSAAGNHQPRSADRSRH